MTEPRVAVVTGSTKGIGRAIVEALLDSGWVAVISSRTEEDVARAAKALGVRHPRRVAGRACDVRYPKECTDLIDFVAERFGRLDLLVNNAGLGRFAPIDEMDPADWDLQVRTNLDGVFHCSRAAVPHLERTEGWIVNIGSLAGRNAFAGGVAYNATKFGLLGMSEAMMLDLRQRGVRVTCVMPGSVNTEFFGDVDPDATWRLTAEDIARTVVDVLAYPPRALPSRIEIRPTRPPRG